MEKEARLPVCLACGVPTTRGDWYCSDRCRGGAAPPATQPATTWDIAVKPAGTFSPAIEFLKAWERHWLVQAAAADSPGWRSIYRDYAAGYARAAATLQYGDWPA